MALFFDQSWFDARLAKVGMTRADIAAALGLSPTQIDEIWKDQRELLPREVSILAALLGVAPAEIVDKAGVATPLPGALSGQAPGPVPGPVLERLDAIDARLERVERMLSDLMRRAGRD